MATVLADGKVLFAGMYPASATTNTEALLRHIGSHYQKAQKRQAQYQLSSAGLTLSVLSENGEAPKPIKIPMQNIRDVVVNPYSTVCLITVFIDQNARTNYLVCECRQEQGAAKVARNFRHFKQSVIGEGYKIDLKKPEGHNWLLKTDQRRSISEESTANGHPVIHHEPEVLERTPTKPGEERLYDVGVQADYGDPDAVSIASSTAMRDEILQMSQEVRDIQNQLKNVSISGPEYIGQERPPNGLFSEDSEGDTHNNHANSHTKTTITRTQVHADVHMRKSSMSDGESESTGKRVNFDPVRTVIKPAGYVSRSYGVQTEGKHSKFSKRQPPPGAINFSYGQQRGWILFRSRSRSASSSSNPPSPLSPGPEGHNEVFEKSSHRGSLKGPVMLPASVKSTVVRSIEDVYPRTLRRPRSTRSQVMMYPGSGQTVARRTSSSSSGGNSGVHTGNPNPIKPVSFIAPDNDHNADFITKKGHGRGEVEAEVTEK